jgi:quinol monooxygenase YgiN
MAAHLLVEYTAEDDAVEEAQAAARTFREESLANEPHLVRHEAHRIDETRTFLHVLEFEDSLALREHRDRPHTETFTEEIADLLDGELDVRRLRPLASE